MMKKLVLSATFATLLALGVGSSMAQDAKPTPDDPIAKVAARKALMGVIDVTVQTMKLSAQDGKFDLLATSERSAALAAMFRAFPQLFPTDSNFRAKDESPEVVTGANPQIWDNYAQFAALAETAAAQAEEAGAVGDSAALLKAVESIETTCNSCHEPYFTFVPPTSPYLK